MRHGLTYGEKFIQKTPPHIKCYSKDGKVQPQKCGIDYDLVVLAIFLFCIVATVAYFAIPMPSKAHADTVYVSDAQQEKTYCQQAVLGVKEVRGATYQQIVSHCKKYLSK